MPTLRVNTATLNVRRTPDSTLSSNIVAQIPRDFVVDLLSEPAHLDWHFIRFTRSGQTIEGWVSKRLTEIIPDPVTDTVTDTVADARADSARRTVGQTIASGSFSAQAADAQPAPVTRYVVNTATLNVRSTPTSDVKDNILTQLKRGDTVDALAEQPDAGWLRVRLPLTGKIIEGWVSRRLVVTAEVFAAQEAARRAAEAAAAQAVQTLVWRMGMNMREFVFYGTAAEPHTRDALQIAQLDVLKNLGVKTVRIFAAHELFNAHQIAPLLHKALTRIQQAGMSAIVCLNDALSGKRMIVQGEGGWHTEVAGHLNKRYFHDKLYRQFFHPFIDIVLGAVQDHPALLMVELGNEYAIHPQPASPADADAFLAFAQETGDRIRAIAPKVLITTGLVNSNHVAAAGRHAEDARRLHQLPVIDVMSLHYYAHDGERDKAPVDIAVAKALGKPFFFGEIGMERGSGDRAAFHDHDIARWKNDGAFSVMPWAFFAEGGDVGVCDIYGVGPIHGDFDAICAVVKKYQ